MDHTTGGLMDAFVYRCPIDACAWERTGPLTPEDITKWPQTPDLSLPDPVGAVARYAAALTDAALQEHLDTHTSLEWLREHARLRERIVELEALMELPRTFTGGGPCKDKAPGSVRSWVVCTLPEGHEGWHHSKDDGSAWSHGSPRPEEG